MGLAASTVFAKQFVPVLPSTNLESKIGLDHWKPHMLFCSNNNKRTRRFWRWRNS